MTGEERKMTVYVTRTPSATVSTRQAILGGCTLYLVPPISSCISIVPRYPLRCTLYLFKVQLQIKIACLVIIAAWLRNCTTSCSFQEVLDRIIRLRFRLLAVGSSSSQSLSCTKRRSSGRISRYPKACK